jgi:hypothetical protein
MQHSKSLSLKIPQSVTEDDRKLAFWQCFYITQQDSKAKNPIGFQYLLNRVLRPFYAELIFSLFNRGTCENTMYQH